MVCRSRRIRDIAYPLVKAGQICGFIEDMDGGGEEPEEDPEYEGEDPEYEGEDPGYEGEDPEYEGE